MSYPDAGTDKRLLPGLGWLQKALILRWDWPKEEHLIRFTVKGWKFEDWNVVLQLWPPFLLAEKQLGIGRWRQFRIGWCWRQRQTYYIPGVAWKIEQSPLPDYDVKNFI